MKPLVRRIEVWSDLACNSGVALGSLPDWFDDVVEESFEGIAAIERFTFSVPRVSYYASEIVIGRIVRVLYVDASFDEYRITALSSATDSGVLVVSANGILFDLAKSAEIVSENLGGVRSFALTLGNATPSTHLTNYVLAFAAPFWSLGTVTPTALIAPEIVDATPYQAALAIGSAANLAESATYELVAERNGTTGYWLHLKVKGGTAPVAAVRADLNLIALSRQQDQLLGHTTRAVVIGDDGRGLDNAWFLVTAYSDDAWIEITDVDGSAVNPIPEDDVFNGLRIQVDDKTGTYPIIDTERSTRRLYMNPTPAGILNHWIRIVKDSSRTPVAYLDRPSKHPTPSHPVIGVLRPTTPGQTNLIKNGNFADWSGALPTSWSGNAFTPPTKVTDPALVLFGGYSAAMAAAGSPGLSQFREIWVNVNEVVTYQVWINILALQGPSTSHCIRPVDLSGVAEAYPTDGSYSQLNRTGETLLFSKSYTASSSGLRALQITIDQGSYTVQGVQVLVTPPGVDIPTTFVRHSGGAKHWLTAARYLEQFADPPSSWDLAMVDLDRAYPSAYLNSRLEHGAQIRVTEPDIAGGSVDLRAVGIRTVHSNPLDTRVVLATRQAALSHLLA